MRGLAGWKQGESRGSPVTVGAGATTPNQLRWLPPSIEPGDHTFVEGMTTLAGAGEPSLRAGLGMHVYTATVGMGDSCLVNSDGDLLLVPQEGALSIRTECAPRRRYRARRTRNRP